MSTNARFDHLDWPAGERKRHRLCILALLVLAPALVATAARGESQLDGTLLVKLDAGFSPVLFPVPEPRR